MSQASTQPRKRGPKPLSARSTATDRITVETHDSGPVQLTSFHARPCPFCGALPSIQFWHGGGPQKRLIHCTNEDGCAVQPSVTGSTRRRALRFWNQRADAGKIVIPIKHGAELVADVIERIEWSEIRNGNAVAGAPIDDLNPPDSYEITIYCRALVRRAGSD